MTFTLRVPLGLLLSLIAMLSVEHAAQAQFGVPGHFFFEDFEDGIVTDNDPVNWRRGAWSGARDAVVDGTLEINNTFDQGSSNNGFSGYFPRNSNNTEWLTYESAVYRTRGRITQVGGDRTEIGIIARSTAPSGYFAEINADGLLQLYEFPVGGPAHVFGSLATDIDPVNNDVILELATAETGPTTPDIISFRAWEFGDTPPPAPQLSGRSDQFPFGTFGIYITTSETARSGASAAFRWASVSEVPEPTTAGLSVCAVVAGGLMRRRRSVGVENRRAAR